MIIRRILPLLLVFLFLPTAFSESADPHALTNTSGFVYRLLEGGNAEIEGYTGKDENLVIPERLDGHTVLSIAARAFSGASFSEVTVPESVMVIGSQAFEHCSSLQAVHLPDGLQVLGVNAFLGNESLTSVNLPDSLRQICDGIFSLCPNLSEVELSEQHPSLQLLDGVLLTRENPRLIWYPMTKTDESYTVPEGTVSIGTLAFTRQAALKKVSLPDSIREISSDAFEGCYSLLEINIPAHVTELSGALNTCWNLRSIDVSPENPVFFSIDGVLFQRDCNRLVLYPSGRKDGWYDIPFGTQIIGINAFQMSDFSEVEIPGTVQRIESNAFWNCSSLRSVVIHEGVEALGSFCFQLCSALEEITLPRSLTEIGSNPFLNSESLARVIVDADHPTLAVMDGALVCKGDMCLVWYPPASDETVFTVPDGIRIIGAAAFHNCSRLTEVILPEGLEEICYDAFYGCTGLKRIVLPSSLTEIDRSAFQKDYTASDLTDAVCVVQSGSYAENFCQAYGLSMEYAEEAHP